MSQNFRTQEITKTRFQTGLLRELTAEENKLTEVLVRVINAEKPFIEIAVIPDFVSGDMKERFLVFHSSIASKITRDHGAIILGNLILNANDWDIAIRNVDRNPDKINLIKRISLSENFLVIGANRDNGYFLLTHYEVVPLAGNELKSLLGRGDPLDKHGFPLEPFVDGTFFRNSEPERVSGKDTDVDTVPS